MRIDNEFLYVQQERAANTIIQCFYIKRLRGDVSTRFCRKPSTHDRLIRLQLLNQLRLSYPKSLGWAWCWPALKNQRGPLGLKGFAVKAWYPGRVFGFHYHLCSTGNEGSEASRDLNIPAVAESQTSHSLARSLIGSLRSTITLAVQTCAILRIRWRFGLLIQFFRSYRRLFRWGVSGEVNFFMERFRHRKPDRKLLLKMWS